MATELALQDLVGTTVHTGTLLRPRSDSLTHNLITQHGTPRSRHSRRPSPPRQGLPCAHPPGTNRLHPTHSRHLSRWRRESIEPPHWSPRAGSSHTASSQQFSRDLKHLMDADLMEVRWARTPATQARARRTCAHLDCGSQAGRRARALACLSPRHVGWTLVPRQHRGRGGGAGLQWWHRGDTAEELHA